MDIYKFIELGSLSVILIFCIYKFFEYLKSKKENVKSDTAEALRIETANIAEVLRVQNENHLTHIGSDINSGFDRIVDCQQKQTDRLCQKIDILICGISELKGRLK